MAEFEGDVSLQEIEVRKLEIIAEKHKEKLGDYKVIPVGEAGFLLQSEKQLPMAGNDWFLFDYDDTLAATTEVKNQRLSLYTDYAREKCITASDEDLARIMKKTDTFARWELVPGGGLDYHGNVHMSVLTWATDVLSKTAERQKAGENVNMTAEVDKIEQTLDRISKQLKGEQTQEESDPFHFNPDTGKLVLKTKKPWDKGIEDIFMQTMINPPHYEETIEGAENIGQPKDSVNRVNLGVLTFGQPEYQLLKVLELLEKNPELSISQIWVTKMPKGKFIEEMLRTNAARKTDQQYTSGELNVEDTDSGLAYGSGFVLGQHQHTIVMMDDNPKELNSLLSMNPKLREETGAEFVMVRSRRAGTRESDKEWDVVTPNGELDFRSGQLTGKEVVKILQISRFLAMRNRLGDNDYRVRQIADRLRSQGVSEEELQGAA